MEKKRLIFFFFLSYTRDRRSTLNRINVESFDAREIYDIFEGIFISLLSRMK